jgi:hypothetical protein
MTEEQITALIDANLANVSNITAAEHREVEYGLIAFFKYWVSVIMIQAHLMRQYDEVATVAEAAITLSGVQNIGGVTGAVNMRVGVTAQANAAHNGIWLMKNTAWVRATDADSADELTPGMFRVTGGTRANRIFVMFRDWPDFTLDISPINVILQPTQGAGGGTSAGVKKVDVTVLEAQIGDTLTLVHNLNNADVEARFYDTDYNVITTIQRTGTPGVNSFTYTADVEFEGFCAVQVLESA